MIKACNLESKLDCRCTIWDNEPHSFNCFIYFLLFLVLALEYLKYLPEWEIQKYSSWTFFSLVSLRHDIIFSVRKKKNDFERNNLILVKLRQNKVYLRNECFEVSPMQRMHIIHSFIRRIFSSFFFGRGVEWLWGWWKRGGDYGRGLLVVQEARRRNEDSYFHPTLRPKLVATWHFRLTTSAVTVNIRAWNRRI